MVCQPRAKERTVFRKNNSLSNRASRYKMSKLTLIFERQLWHYLLLPVLLAGLVIISRVEGFLTGQFIGVSTGEWFFVGIVIPIVHQFYVWICWRTQLHYSLITRLLGRSGFTYYSIIFLILMISRFVLIFFLAMSNKNSLDANPILLYGLSIIFGFLVLYVLYFIARFFTFRRALGIDHFDPSYRSAELVKEGIFRFADNAMYTFGLLILWIPGLLFSSKAALAVALFSHVYIWVHYYCTEKPDMRKIYGKSVSSENR